MDVVTEIPIPVHPSISSQDLQRTVIALASIFDLDGTEATLRKYPGSVHWHLHKPKERGTLEMTWWPEQRKFWISIHDNRGGPWQKAVIEAFCQYFKSLE